MSAYQGVEYAGHGEYVAVFHFDAGDCEGIAFALGVHDAGAEEMLKAAEAIRMAEGRDDL